MDSIKKCVGMNTYNEYMSIKVDSLRESKNMFKYRNKRLLLLKCKTDRHFVTLTSK